MWSIVITNKWSLIRNKTRFNPESYLAIWHRVWVEISRSEEERGEAIPVDRYLESYGVPLQLINDVSVQVEVGGACLCDSTAAPPLLDIATVAITDYYNSYVSSAFFIGCSVDIEMVTGYHHVRLSTWWFKTQLRTFQEWIINMHTKQLLLFSLQYTLRKKWLKEQ